MRSIRYATSSSEVRPHHGLITSESLFEGGRQGLRLGARNDHTEHRLRLHGGEERWLRVPRYEDTQTHASDRCNLLPGVYFERDEWDFVVDITDYFETAMVQGEATSHRATHQSGRANGWRSLWATRAGSAGPGTRRASNQETPFLLPKIGLPESVLKGAEETEAVRHTRMVGKFTCQGLGSSPTELLRR